MAKLAQAIKRCGGGMVQFGLTGQGSSVYQSKFQMCISPWQDERYGVGMRLHNPCGKEDKGFYRCTVCGSGHGVVRP